MRNKKCYNPPDRRRKKKVSSRSIAAKIASSMLATITAATTIASPVLTYAADVNGTDTVTEATTDASQGETKTIISTETNDTTADSDSDSKSADTEKSEKTKFLFVNLKTTGGKIVIDEKEDNEQTVKLAKHKSDDGKTDEMRIDVYDKDDILVSSEDAAKNNYTYAYEVKADSVANVKADADDGYILKLYDVVEGDTKKDSGFDKKTDGISGEFEYPVFMDSNVAVKVEFEKEETKEDGKTAEDISVDTNDTKEADKDAKESAGENGSEKDASGDLTVDDNKNITVSPDGDTITEWNTGNANSTDISVNDNTEEKVEPTPVDKTDEDKADTTDATDEASENQADSDSSDSKNNENNSTDTQDLGENSAVETDGPADTTNAEETLEEHFTDTTDIESGLDENDFSTARLLVMTTNESVIVDKEHLIGSYDDIYLLQYKDVAQAMAAYTYYKVHAEAVEPDAKVTAADEADVNETGSTETITSENNAISALNADSYSAAAQNSKKVIALIDTGASESRNVIDRISLIDNVLNGGTHGDDMVNNIVSQNAGAQILSIRALGNDGYGSYSAVVSAIEYAINSDVDIINLSMYSPKTLATSVLEAEIQKAIDDNITVVGAAGNDGKDVAGYVPGSIRDVYTIGAATVDGIRVTNSNYGELVDYYAVADSTSQAAAKFTGFVSKNGLSAVAEDKSGLFFETVNNSNSDVDVADKDVDTVKDNDTIYDPVIEKYVKEHADQTYVGKGQLSMTNVMDVDATIASAEELNKGETIDSLMAGDDFRFITQQTGRVPVYELSKDSDYFVTFADVMHNDKRATAIDYQIALNDTTGSSISGTYFDKDTGLLYIPKAAYYGDDGKYYIQRIQTQILYSIKNFDINNTWNSSVVATTEEANGNTESKISGADILDQRMSVQVGRNMDVNTMLVTVNGFPINGTCYVYDSKTGMLTLGFSSAVVQSVWVQAKKNVDAPDVEPGMKAADLDVRTLDDMLPVTNQAITANIDKLKRGYAFQSEIKLLYPDSADNDDWAGINQGNTVPAYRGQTGSNPSYEQALLDFVYYGNKADTDFLQNGKVYGPVSGSIYPFIIKIPSITCTDIKFAEYPWETNMAMECVHTDMPGSEGSVPTSNWYSAKIWGRIVKANSGANPYAVIAVYTSKCTTQHGFGLFKVKLKSSTGKLTVKKVSSNTSAIQGRSSYYSLQGATYGIYSDSACKKLVKTVKTDKNGLVTVSINTGTYWVKETTPSKGYGLDTTVHQITITSGKTGTVNSKEPPQPGTLTVHKTFDLFQSLVTKTSRIGTLDTEFTVYSNSGCTTIAKDSSGKDAKVKISTGKKVSTAVGSVKLWPGSYYVKETGRIKGTASNIKLTYGPVKVTPKTTVDISSAVPSDKRDSMRMTSSGYVRDIPFYWTGTLLTKKNSTETKVLPGAVFLVNYSEGKNPYSAKRTWYFVTDKNGQIKYDEAHLVDNSTSASATAKKTYKGKSSPLFQNPITKHCFLPVCTLHIKEVMAPEGYERDTHVESIDVAAPASEAVKVGGTTVNTRTSFYAKLTNAHYKVLDPESHDVWSVKVQARKVDKDGKPLAGAVFGVYESEADANGRGYPITRLTTDATGYTEVYKISGLKEEVATYTLYCIELKAPDGRALSDKVYPLTFKKTDFDKLSQADKDKGGQLQLFGGDGGIVNGDNGWAYSMQVKKINEKKEPLQGAVFEVYSNREDAESGDDPLFTLTTGEDGLTPLLTLKAETGVASMTYYCKEVKAPDDYQIGTVSSGTDGDEDSTDAGTPIYEQTWTLDEYNSLPNSQQATGKTKYFGPEEGVVNLEKEWALRYNVKKVDAQKNPLAGAKFSVFTQEDCSEESKIAELETDGTGYTDTMTYGATSSTKSVTLYCKETQAPDGYAIDEEVYPQTWNYEDYKEAADGEEDGELKQFGPEDGIVNDNSAWKVLMKVKKVDNFGHVLKGAVFGVYTKESCEEASRIGELETQEDGISDTITYDVPYKQTSVTLYCKEIQAPEGYIPSKEVYSQTWYRSKYEEIMKKQEEEAAAAEAEEAAKAAEENGEADVAVTADDSGDSGSTDTGNGGSGDEGGSVDEGEGTEVDDAFGEMLFFGDEEKGIPNDSETWRLQMKARKVDMAGNPLAKAEFTVYADEACTKIVANMVSGSDGWTDTVFVNTKDIDGKGTAEEYTLYCKETKAPEFYKPSDEVYKATWTRKGYDESKNEYGETKIFSDNIVNEPIKPITVKVHKESSAASEILGLSGYSLEGAEFTITDGGSFSGKLVTNADGNSDSIELPNKSAEYTITETKAPAGHVLDSTPQKLKVTVPDDLGKDLTVTFTDEPVFTKDSFQITKLSEKGNPIEGVLFKVEFIDSNDKVTKTWYLVSDEKGFVKMDASYLSKDAAYKSDSFYKYNNKVVIPIGGKLRITEIKAPAQYTVDSTPKYMATGSNVSMKLEVINKLKPCRINIRKFDADGTTPLKGVSFELKFVKEAEKLTSTKNGFTRLLEVGKSITKDTDANGNIVFDNLDQGEYQLTETRTTAGHTLLKDPITVTLPITMSQDEAKNSGADTSKATLDSGYTNKWFFYDCTYEVTNTATFKLPMTGSTGYWKYGIIGFGTLAVLGTGLILMDTRKKRMMNSRKHKRRRK